MIDTYGQQCPHWINDSVIIYDPVHIPFHGDVSLGNGTRFTVGLFRTHKGLFVGVELKGAYTFQIGQFPHPAYIAEKLNVGYCDAISLSDFLACQLRVFEKNFDITNYNKHLIARSDEPSI